MDILHIYAGTSGSAGTYIHEIYKALNKKFKQEVIVSYFYPFNYGKKIFYRYSDLSKPNFLHKIDKVRLIVRYFELFFSLVYIFVFIKIKNPKVINYSLTSQINLERIFLKLVKKYTKCKLYITVHDAIPFETNYSNFEESLKKRKVFFDLADKLIIHNKNSYYDLINCYKIDEKNKIIEFPFPIMDIKDMNYSNQIDNLTSSLPNSKYIFSFVGHLRKEKGITILLEAWEKFNLENDLSNESILVIAGNIPKGFVYDFKKNQNLIVIDRFLNDLEYKNLIEKSHCVILPYIRGTNSGIPSTVLSLNTRLITSDIEMFVNNEIIDKKYVFRSEDVNFLKNVIVNSIYSNYDYTLLNGYINRFEKNINLVFNKEMME